MEQLKQYFDVIQQLQNHLQNNQPLQQAVNGLNQQVSQLKNQRDAGRIKQVLTPILTNLHNQLKAFDTYKLTAIQEDVLKTYGFDKFLGDKYDDTQAELLSKIEQNPTQAQTLVQQFHQELNQLIQRPNQILGQIQPLSQIESSLTFNEDEGVIELIFDGDVGIDDFTDAKKLMSDWFLIIDGYARLIGIQKDEFEIYSISKSSPTKLKIKTAATNAALVLAIVGNLLQIEQRLVGNKVLIEQMKKDSLATPETQQKYIDDVESNMEATKNEEIEKIVEEKMKEFERSNGEGDTESSFRKSIEKQYHFVTHGGTVNVYIESSLEADENIQALEESKAEIKRLREKLINLKQIEATTDESEKSETNSDETAQNE